MMVAQQAAPPWLGLLLSGFAGRSLRVQSLSATVGEPRPILTEHHLLLPSAMLDGDAQALARAAIAHAAAHLRHSPSHQPTAGLKPMSVALVSALEDARVERLAMGELRGLRRWWAPFHAEEPREGDLSVGGFVARLGRVLFESGNSSSNHWVDKGRELFEREAANSLLDREAFRRIGAILANDLGQMRVRFEPQQYRVAPAYRDDNSYLWSHIERPEQPPPDEHQSLDATPQLATLTLREVQAVPGGSDHEAQQEIELGRYLVPEWDHRSGCLKRDWCTVIESVPLAPPRALADVAALPPPLPRAASARLNRARRLRRQLEGDEIDLDAAIEVMIDRRLGLSPDARLFRRPGRDAPPASLLLLLDLSESAGDAVAGAACSVLALEQEAALQVAQTVVRRGRGPASRVAVHGFNSDTRERVSYQRLFDFGAPFDPAAAGRVIAARARHSTRVGAALRHATALLAEEPAGRRTLLVVTDGAPSDIDVFDPHYLVEDARVAVLEAQRLGMQVHCLTLDRAGERAARRIFGWRHYGVVTNPAALTRHLRHVQARAMSA